MSSERQAGLGDKEEGTPQGRLTGEEPAPEESEESPLGDVGAPQEGGADSVADAAREGG